MIRSLAIAVVLYFVSATFVRAEEAVVLRSSAPNVPARMRVEVGQMLSVPNGASVTLLFREGRFVTLKGDASQRVRVESPKTHAASAAEQAWTAMTRRPVSQDVWGATRTSKEFIEALDAMRSGAFPQGDYIDQFVTGDCRKDTCQALEAFVDETVPLTLGVSVMRVDSEAFATVQASADAFVACWTFAPQPAPITPFDGVTPIERNTPVRVTLKLYDGQGLLACTASRTRLTPAQLGGLARAGAIGAAAFTTEALRISQSVAVSTSSY